VPVPPSEISLARSKAAHIMHARHNPLDTTANARRTFIESFYERVREEAAARGEVLDEDEVARRAEQYRKAFYQDMALQSVRARRAKAAKRGAKGAK
jgi:hypothetical protein